MKFTNMSKYIIIPVEEIEAKITDYRKQHKNYLATLITILEKLLNSHKQISLDEKDIEEKVKASEKYQEEVKGAAYPPFFYKGYKQALLDIKKELL